MGKEQALGEATNLGCLRFATPSAITIKRGKTREVKTTT